MITNIDDNDPKEEDVKPNQQQSSGSGNPAKTLECDICLELAAEPVITLCGHLFCWKCICSWLDKGYSDCPTCKGAVSRDNLTPLYGRGRDAKEKEASPDHTSAPRRPEARRQEAPPRRNANFGGSSDFFFSFGFYPIMGFGGQWGLRAQTYRTPEEQRSDKISMFFVSIGFMIVMFILFS